MAAKQVESRERDAEVARETAAAFGRAYTEGEIDAFLALLSPEIAFEVPSVMRETVLKLKGHEGVRRYLEQAATEYDELRVESKEIRECGGGRFLLLGSWQATVRKTRTHFGTPMGAVLDISAGKVTRLRAFFDEQLAVAAAAGD